MFMSVIPSADTVASEKTGLFRGGGAATLVKERDLADPIINDTERIRNRMKESY